MVCLALCRAEELQLHVARNVLHNCDEFDEQTLNISYSFGYRQLKKVYSSDKYLVQPQLRHRCDGTIIAFHPQGLAYKVSFSGCFLYALNALSTAGCMATCPHANWFYDSITGLTAYIQISCYLLHAIKMLLIIIHVPCIGKKKRIQFCISLLV